MLRTALQLAALACLLASVAAIPLPTTNQVTAAASTPPGDGRPGDSYGAIFNVNGARSQFEATVGTPYTFNLASAAQNHKFGIGQTWETTTPITQGVTPESGEALPGAALVWTPQAPGTYYYICTVPTHIRMGNSITVTAAGDVTTASSTAAAAPIPAATSSTGAAAPATATSSSGAAAPATAASSSGAAGSNLNLCQRLTKSLTPTANPTSAADQYAAIQKFVQYVALGDGTQKVPASSGIFNQDATKAYFDGTIKYRRPNASALVTASPYSDQETPNFNTNEGQRNLLVQHLASFLGKDLQCDTTNAAAYPAYPSVGTVTTIPTTQYNVHANMRIGKTAFDAFNAQVLKVAGEYGATAADVPVVTALLNSFSRNTLSPNNQICTQAAGADACACAPSVTGDACGTSLNSAAETKTSFVLLAVAAILALVARA